MEDGEQGDNFDVGPGLFRQPQAVLKNSGPVRNAMIAAQWQGVLGQDGSEDRMKIHGFFAAGLVCQYAQRMKMPCSGSPPPISTATTQDTISDKIPPMLARLIAFVTAKECLCHWKKKGEPERSLTPELESKASLEETGPTNFRSRRDLLLIFQLQPSPRQTRGERAMVRSALHFNRESFATFT